VGAHDVHVKSGPENDNPVYIGAGDPPQSWLKEPKGMATEADTCRTLVLPKLYAVGWINQVISQ
jgi:hypothetical protein